MSALSYSEIYDLLYGAKDYDGEARAVLSILGAGTRTVLDVGCGTGSHAAALAKQGVQVQGMDIDPAMIEVARQRRYEGAAPQFTVGGPDMAPSGPFDGAISLFHVVNYLPDAISLMRFLREIAMRLPKEALFVFDVWNGLAALRDPPRVKRSEIQHDGRLIVASTRPVNDFWHQTTTLEVEIEVIDGSARQSIHHSFVHRLWTPRELSDLLVASGFAARRIATWAHPERPATVDDWKLLFIAEKQ